ncbi:MAG: N-acetylneuraminate synthase [Planctomycetaceae bacterium]|nr:N-acetylneuraminate synthase [Planctomycetaceae bacterium]
MILPQTISISDRLVGDGQPCFVIAEAGVNHNGRLDLALRSIDAAAEAGADAVKFQTFRADRIVTRSAPQARYQQQNMGTEQSQYDMLKALELTDDNHHAIVQHCRDRGVLFMSTPFDEQSASFLQSLDMQVFKMPSGEITNLPFLRHVARFGRPMIISTGMSTLGEVEAAVNAVEEAGNSQIILLHCVSNYPAPPHEVNLRAMLTMKAAFGYLTGYSDHTLGTEVGIASAALGACVLEKHYTLDRSLPGPDHAASAEPAELQQLIRGIRNVESALGNGQKRPSASEMDTAKVARKSLVAAIDIAEGTQLTDDMIAVRRPGTGLPPAMKPHLLNRRIKVSLAAGDLLQLEDVA